MIDDDSQEGKRLALPSISSIWDRLDNESEAAYTAFCQYLKLPLVGQDNPRRRVVDLARQNNKTQQAYSIWFAGHRWVERAAAYDEYRAKHPLDVADLEERRQFTQEIREIGKLLIDKGIEVIDAIDVKNARLDDARKLIVSGLALKREAQALDKPGADEDKDYWLERLRAITAGATEGVIAAARRGKLAGVEDKAVGRGVRVPEQSDQEALEGVFSEVPGEAGPVCEGSAGSNLVE